MRCSPATNGPAAPCAMPESAPGSGPRSPGRSCGGSTEPLSIPCRCGREAATTKNRGPAMAKILGNFHLALLIGLALLLLVMFGLHGEAIGDKAYWAGWLRFFHV